MSSELGTHRLVLGESEPIASLPDPPLVDRSAGIRLRPWTASRTDAEALAAAWDDPAIAAASQVPDDRSVDAAMRWIAGDAARRAAGRGLDLVVSPIDGAGVGPGVVLGEVGLRNPDPVRRRAEISWWTAPDHRGRGVATAATRLVASWALAPDGLGLVQVWARIAPSNRASARIAAAAGLADLGVAAGTHVWARGTA